MMVDKTALRLGFLFPLAAIAPFHQSSSALSTIQLVRPQETNVVRNGIVAWCRVP
ncbi:hypothetical protein EDE05_102339 [Neorhizobium sp. R1-B]|jgi:hypothetical protein|nr:hypothetical protein EDE05_102339 [Neorhizobium sp. R1-B]